MLTLLSLVMIAAVLVLTATAAGLIPSLLFFRTLADRRVLWIGGVAIAMSWWLVWIGVPPVVRIEVDYIRVYPLLVVASAFPVGLVWRLLTAAAPAPQSEAEREAESQARALAKARRLNRGA